VNELLDGPNMRSYAVTWLGSQPDREQIAKRISPLTYVRAGLPPVMIIQGDADPVVPYTQSVRLNKALDDAGVPHEFVTIPGGKHGRFSGPEMEMIYTHVWAFLGKYLPNSH
jgi:dipeptidyl aminopeptidase/acylaminoacyl peptidase